MGKGNRAAIILFGGSGAGKTHQTKLLMDAFGQRFTGGGFTIKMGVTEVIGVSSKDVKALDLIREAYPLDKNKKNCVAPEAKLQDQSDVRKAFICGKKSKDND